MTSDAVPPPRAAGMHISSGMRHGQDGYCGPSPGRPEGMQSESGRNGSYSSIVASGSDLGVRLKLNRLVDHLWPTMAVMTALLYSNSSITAITVIDSYGMIAMNAANASDVGNTVIRSNTANAGDAVNTCNNRIASINSMPSKSRPQKGTSRS